MKLKKYTAILFTLCLIIAMMPLAVFAEPSADGDEGTDGADSVYILGRRLEDGELPASVPHKGKIEYDSDTATLTLTGAMIDMDDFKAISAAGNIAAGIYATSDINIVLSGSNAIMASSNDYPRGTEYVSGIAGYETVAFSGDSGDSLSISLAGNNNGNKSIEFSGISAGGSVTADKVSLKVDMGACGICTGIYAWEPVSVNGGAYVKVNADGSGSRAVSGVNSIGNSEVNDDSVLEMSSEGSAFYCWTPGSSLKEADVVVSNKKDGSGAVEWDKKSALYEYRYVKITGPDGDGSRFGDDVRVLGRKIDENNADDVFGDGTVSFDLESDTLTLRNANLDLKDFHHEYDDDPNPDSGTNEVIGIDADRDINIILEGENRIYSTAQSYDSKKQYVKGINAGSRVSVNVGGSGSLDIDLDKNNEALSYTGIDVAKAFNVDGIPLTVSMKGSLDGTGIDCWMMSEVSLTDGAVLKVSAEGEGSTALDYRVADGLSMDENSMLEMVSDGTAFGCWSVSAELKEIGALVNDAATSEGAAAWDRTTLLESYKYVRFPENYSHKHSARHFEAKPATCDEPGSDEYWRCSCGKYFTGEDGETETDPPVIYPATGHKYGKWTSISDEQHQRVCSNDSSHKETAEHVWDGGKVIKKPTLLRKGKKKYTCTDCGKTRTVDYTLKDCAKEAAEKVVEWIRKIFGDGGAGPDAAVSDVKVPETSSTYNGEDRRPVAESEKAGDAGLGQKAANPISVRGKTASVKYKRLRKKAQTVKAWRVMSLSNAKGRIRYELKSVSRSKYRKYFIVDPSNGSVKVRKNLRKGTYILTVSVSASGDADHDAGAAEVTCRIIVK